MKWLKEFNHLYGPDHLIRESVDDIPPLEWAVVFIDDSPGGDNRANHFRRFIEKSIYVVVHDYHLENEDHVGSLLPQFHHVTKTYQPPTLVASQLREPPKSILCL